MDRIVRRSLLLSIVVLMSLTAGVLCHPLPHNDIIAGNEFLSLFIRQNNGAATAASTINTADNEHKSPSLTSPTRHASSLLPSSTTPRLPQRNTLIDETENEEEDFNERLPIEAMFSVSGDQRFGLRLHRQNRVASDEKTANDVAKSNSNEDDGITVDTTGVAIAVGVVLHENESPQNDGNESRSRNLINNHNNHNSLSSSSSSSRSSSSSISNTSVGNEKEIRLVTSGSKIVFLEEPHAESPDTTELSYSKSKVHIDAIDAIEANSVATLFEETTTITATPPPPPSNRTVKVITVTVTSSVGDISEQHIEEAPSPKGNLFNHTTSDTLFNNEFIDENDAKLISNSHKSEFSIEEDDPLTQERIADSVNGESSNVQSIIAAPESSQMPQVKSRTQRKQEGLIPFQTVIFHDGNGYKEGNTQPRSVSYSSIGQNVGELKSWRSFDPFGETMRLTQNKSEPEVRPPTNYPDHSAKIYSEPEKVYGEPAKIYSEPSKIYSEPAKIYSEPSKIYSQPSKVYGVPEKVYSEPAKIYSEPAKIYSEPAKIYSEPSKIYSEPAKVYGLPSKVYSQPAGSVETTTLAPASTTKRIIFNLDRLPYDLLNAPVDAAANSLGPNLGKFHPSARPVEHDDVHVSLPPLVDRQTTLPPSSSSADDDDSQKVGYVVEGANFRKYRVEERTSDGFIVGEYGVVSHDDGNTRGVRYTADSNINPRLIYDALMKFLSL